MSLPSLPSLPSSWLAADVVADAVAALAVAALSKLHDVAEPLAVIWLI
jgi:hypothetical protein